MRIFLLGEVPTPRLPQLLTGMGAKEFFAHPLGSRSRHPLGPQPAVTEVAGKRARGARWIMPFCGG
jgi:hypothetical protein